MSSIPEPTASAWLSTVAVPVRKISPTRRATPRHAANTRTRGAVEARLGIYEICRQFIAPVLPPEDELCMGQRFRRVYILPPPIADIEAPELTRLRHET